jgi:hypothetical protein
MPDQILLAKTGSPAIHCRIKLGCFFPSYGAFMKKFCYLIPVALLAFGLVPRTVSADPLVVGSIQITPKTDGNSYPALAKVSLQEAVKIATAASGKKHTLMATIDVNWHDEKLGYLVYDIDMVGDTKGAVTAAFVDPGNGKVLATWEEDWINGVPSDEKPAETPQETKKIGAERE